MNKNLLFERMFHSFITYLNFSLLQFKAPGCKLVTVFSSATVLLKVNTDESL